MDPLSVSAVPLLVYGLVAVLVMLDGVFPVLPGEAAVVSAGALAAAGELHLVWAGLAALVGVVAGDALTYALGRGVLKRPLDRLPRHRRPRRSLDVALRALARHGTAAVVAMRFVPLGRTATAAGAGYLHMPVRLYAAAVIIGGTAWSAVNSGLGYAAGTVVDGPVWQRVAISLGAAAAVTTWVVAIRRVRAVRRRLS